MQGLIFTRFPAYLYVYPTETRLYSTFSMLDSWVIFSTTISIEGRSDGRCFQQSSTNVQRKSFGISEAGRDGLSPSITFNITVQSRCTWGNGWFRVCSYNTRMLMWFHIEIQIISPPMRHKRRNIHHWLSFVAAHQCRTVRGCAALEPSSEWNPHE